jgi:sugar fermentation stimulation protein A
MAGVKYFAPNYATHAEFGETLKTVTAKGVEAVAYDCFVTADSMEINCRVPIKL